jgi:heterodisulfide reductase subunit A
VGLPTGVSPESSPSFPLEKTLRWNGRQVRNIAFIHCVGSRQIEGIHEPREGGELNQYCSRVCCTATLQAANELKDSFPNTEVFDFYRDIRTYGRGHEEYYENASKKGFLFFRFAPEEAPVVEQTAPGSEHPVTVRVKDRLTFGEEMEVQVDLVVLAVGMVPRKVDDLVEMLKLPVGSDGYLLEVHPKLRPVEVAVNGVLLAGTSQGPKDITESAASASAAAVKAATILSKGYVDLDPYVAEVIADRCDGCGECVAICGYEGALVMRDSTADGGSVAEINGALCKGCGACVAVCPKGAIELKGWTVEQYDAMVDAILAEDLVVEAAR